MYFSIRSAASWANVALGSQGQSMLYVVSRCYLDASPTFLWRPPWPICVHRLSATAGRNDKEDNYPASLYAARVRWWSIGSPFTRLRHRLKVGLRHSWKPTVPYTLCTHYEANNRKLIKCLMWNWEGRHSESPFTVAGTRKNASLRFLSEVGV